MPPCGDFHLFEPLFLRRLFFLSVLYHFLRVVADLRLSANIGIKIDIKQDNKNMLLVLLLCFRCEVSKKILDCQLFRR